MGNIRVAYGNDGTGFDIRQINSYYPFGMSICSLSANLPSTLAKNEYLYNGKMFQDELGLNWYDYGARFYDPVVGRWSVIDNKAEKYLEYSPYVYAANNPIRFIDPDGNDWFDQVVGFLAAVVDNALDVDLRGSYPPQNATDYNTGQDIGDVGSILMGMNEVDAGAGLAAGSVAVTTGTGGLSIEITAPTAAAGTIMVGHGGLMMANGAKNFSEQKGRVLENNSGSGAPTGRPGKNIAKENGVTVKSHGTNDAHKPAHAHVKGEGGNVRIGPNGKPLKGEAELSTKQKNVVENNKSAIRNEVNKVGKANKRIEEYNKNK